MDLKRMVKEPQTAMQAALADLMRAKVTRIIWWANELYHNPRPGVNNVFREAVALVRSKSPSVNDDMWKLIEDQAADQWRHIACDYALKELRDGK